MSHNQQQQQQQQKEHATALAELRGQVRSLQLQLEEAQLLRHSDQEQHELALQAERACCDKLTRQVHFLNSEDDTNRARATAAEQAALKAKHEHEREVRLHRDELSGYSVPLTLLIPACARFR